MPSLKYKSIKFMEKYAPSKLIVLSMPVVRFFNRNKTTQEVFSQIYSNQLWGGEPGEFFSGSGSIGKHAEEYVEEISKYINSLGDKTIKVVDLGCGDFRVGKQLVDKTKVHYIGVDIVPALIDRNIKEFSNDQVEFHCLNIISEKLPKGNVCLVRQVFQHLSNDQIAIILQKLKGYKAVFITESYLFDDSDVVPNKDKQEGIDTRIFSNSGVYLDKEPFNLEVDLFLSCKVNAREEIRTFQVNFN